MIHRFILLGVVLAGLGCAHTTKENLELPVLVEDQVYEIYTDSEFHKTKLYINDHLLEVGEGYGSLKGPGYSLSGHIGKSYKTRINGLLKPGDNNIKIIFEPSSIIEQAFEQNAQDKIIPEMLTRVLLVRGVLTDSDKGERSKVLDELLTDKNRTFQIIKDVKSTQFVLDTLKENQQVEFNFPLHKEDQVKHLTIKSCGLSIDHNSEFFGKLFLNKKLIHTFNGDRRTNEEWLSTSIQQGKNELELKVDSMSEDKLSLKVNIECDLRKTIESSRLPKDSYYTGEGHWNKVNIEMANYSLSKPGEVKSFFNISYDDGLAAIKKAEEEKQTQTLIGKFKKEWGLELVKFQVAYAQDADLAVANLRALLTSYKARPRTIGDTLYDGCYTIKDKSIQMVVKKLVGRFLMNQIRGK